MAQDPTKSINKRLRDVEYTLEKLKAKRQILRKAQRERRRREYARVKNLGLLKGHYSYFAVSILNTSDVKTNSKSILCRF